MFIAACWYRLVGSFFEKRLFAYLWALLSGLIQKLYFAAGDAWGVLRLSSLGVIRRLVGIAYLRLFQMPRRLVRRIGLIRFRVMMLIFSDHL